MTDSSENETSRPRQRKPCIACREPIQPDARICPQCGSPQSGTRWKFLGTTLKWIGAVTALISLIAGSFQLNGLLQASRERSEAVQKLVKAADMQIEYGDLESALQLVEQAIELQPGSRAAGERQVTVAMMLFRRGFDFTPKGYAEKIDSLMPVLYRGAMDADPARAADALAHIGRANKMRRFAQNKEFPIEDYFQRAVALDADNVFAHVFWAVSCLDNSWRMECGNNLEAAEEHFAMGMKDGRHQDYVRRKRFDSLRATSVDGADILLIGDMITSWRNKVPLDEKQQSMILTDVSGFYDPDEQSTQKLQNLVQRFQPAEVLDMLEWASEGQKWKDDWEELRIMALMAHLTELTGNRPLALERYRAARVKSRREELTSTGNYVISSIRERVDWSLANLLEIRPGWLGIKYERINEELARSLGMADEQGLFISEVIPAGPAEVGGLLTGDVILEVEGRAPEYQEYQSIEQIIGPKVAGDTLALTIFRKGERKLLQLTLGEAKASSVFLSELRHIRRETTPLSLLMDQMLYRSHTIDVGEKSMRIATLTDELRTGFEVNTDAPAVLILDSNLGEWESGLRAGDLILAVNNQPVSSAEEVAAMIEQARKNGESSLLFDRLRAGERQAVAIKIN